MVCVSADPKVRGLALCAEGAGGGQLVVDPLASRVEMEALVAGGKCVCFVGVLRVCLRGLGIGIYWSSLYVDRATADDDRPPPPPTHTVREMEEEAGIEGATLGTAEEELRRFRLDRPADRKFLSELQALLRLPAQAKEAYSSNAKSKRGGHNSNKRGLFGGGGKKQQEQEQEQGESRPATDVFLYAADGLRMVRGEV